MWAVQIQSRKRYRKGKFGKRYVPYLGGLLSVWCWYLRGKYLCPFFMSFRNADAGTSDVADEKTESSTNSDELEQEIKAKSMVVLDSVEVLAQQISELDQNGCVDDDESDDE